MVYALFEMQYLLKKLSDVIRDSISCYPMPAVLPPAWDRAFSRICLCLLVCLSVCLCYERKWLKILTPNLVAMAGHWQLACANSKVKGQGQNLCSLFALALCQMSTHCKVLQCWLMDACRPNRLALWCHHMGCQHWSHTLIQLALILIYLCTTSHCYLTIYIFWQWLLLHTVQKCPIVSSHNVYKHVIIYNAHGVTVAAKKQNPVVMLRYTVWMSIER